MANVKHRPQMDVASRNRRIRDILKTLEFNKMSLEKSSDELTVVENKIEKENNKVMRTIAERVKLVKQRLDEYVSKLNKELNTNYERNLRAVQESRNFIVRKLETTELDIIKCKEILKGFDPNSDPKFNKDKVMEFMTESIGNSKFYHPGIELTRVDVTISITEKDIKPRMEDIIGVLQTETEMIGEVLYPGIVAKSTQTPDIEINALTVPKVGNDVWLNCGVSNELLGVNFESRTNIINWKTIVLAVKINDIAVGSDGRIYITSPDSKVARCLKTTKNNKYVQLFTIDDDLYLHSVTLCEDIRKIAVCGTDAKNYSSEPPNEVVIIELTTEGRELKRTAVSGYSGKVYRIAENIQRAYVLTFPKEGVILSVNGNNGSILSRFDKDDFKLCIPRGLNTLGLDFWPSGVCCTSIGHVYVSEYVNKLVIMLDQDFRFLRFIDDNHTCPNALCFQNETSTLWIGDKGIIKVWKVM